MKSNKKSKHQVCYIPGAINIIRIKQRAYIANIKPADISIKPIDLVDMWA